MLLPSLGLVSFWALSFGHAFVFPLPPLQQQHHVINPNNALEHTSIIRHTTTDSDTSRESLSSSLPVKAVAGEEGASTAGGRSIAKQRFLDNLKRKRAGGSVPSSVLDADLALLRTPRGGGGRAHGAAPSTTATAADSWRGKWEICYAPHIETLGKVILTKFAPVEYVFNADDGRMVSHAGFESKVFGSGWFNADGRVVPVPPTSPPSISGSTTTGVGEDEARQDVVQVRILTMYNSPLCWVASRTVASAVWCTHSFCQ